MRGISPLIGAVMLISIVITLGALLSPWVARLGQGTVNSTGTDVNKEIYCRDMSYDFVTDYGNGGIEWDFSGGADYIMIKIKNYGTVDVYGISFEAELSDFSVRRFPATQATQKTESRPLRPGESAVIEANITEDLSATMEKLTVRNGMECTPLVTEL